MSGQELHCDRRYEMTGSKAITHCSATFYLFHSDNCVFDHLDVTITVNIKDSTVPDPADMTTLLTPGASLFEQVPPQGRKQGACSRRQQNGARLYLREVIPLIYKTPKQRFLPPPPSPRHPHIVFLVFSHPSTPFKRDLVPL